MLPEITPKDFELTLEQQFMLVRYTQMVDAVSPEDLCTGLLEISRQLMIKDNVIRSLIRGRL